jgi:hypothetical protein
MSNAFDPPAPRRDTSLPNQFGALQQSPQPISNAFDPPAPRRDTIGSSDGSPSLSSAREVASSSSPSLPWLAPAAASSATSLPSTTTSPAPPAGPFAAGPPQEYRPAREDAAELDAGFAPSCLVVPMPVDAPRPAPPRTAFLNPPGGAPTSYERVPALNPPWNMRYANFQGAVSASAAAAAAPEVGPVVPEKIPVDRWSTDGEKILGSQPSPADKMVGVGGDGDKILGSPPDAGAGVSHDPPLSVYATRPVLWAASTATLVQSAAQSPEAARQVSPPEVNQIPEVTGSAPPAEVHGHQRATSVNATADGVSQVVLERRKQRARHRLLGFD